MCTIKRNDENKLKHKLPNLASWDNDIKRAVVAATNEFFLIFFSRKTINIFFIYLLAPFIVQILRADPKF